MKNIPLVSLLLLMPALTVAQTFQQQNRQLLAYNVGFAGVVGGVGGIIHKKPGQSAGQAFGRGFLSGAAGGVLTYAGKRVAFKITDHRALGYGWVSKVIHTTGASITENAAAGRGFLENWAMEYGPVRLDVRQGQARVRLQPVAALAMAYCATEARLDLRKSLALGTPYFYAQRTESFGLASAGGKNVGNSIIITGQTRDAYRTASHEFLHGLQNREFQALNGWLAGLDARAKAQRPWYRGAARYVHLDLPWFGVAYGLEHITFLRGGSYNSNHFELEVKHFSENRYIPTR